MPQASNQGFATMNLDEKLAIGCKAAEVRKDLPDSYKLLLKKHESFS